MVGSVEKVEHSLIIIGLVSLSR